MDSEKIAELLSKYWNCETTLEEEKQLQAYFRNSQVPDSLNEPASLFRYFEQQRQKELTDLSFDKRVIRKLRASGDKMRALIFNSMRIAAGIVVLIVAVWLVRLEVRRAAPSHAMDTYDDPKMAFEETKKALMMISRSFSTAEEQARKINLFNEAQENIKKEKPKAEL